ncbi:uncharacterized protein LOC133204818 [Saccostrea echinata]|uniref:uncharacterized protein LOC133204818 n=1 Tax=Saccostrea echinata TaxID=191078 RepID=UPI002A835E2A|nr:uncharacterized protein LOC133204818 [Saccostrea echinata]
MAAAETPRKKMFRFSVKHDIDLLICVTAVNPYAGDAANKWSEIAESFMEIYDGVAIDGRRCRERTSLLLSYFKSEDREKLYRSGCDEDYSKKEQLLQEVLELSESQHQQKKEKQKENEKGMLIRKKAMENMTASTASLTTDPREDDELPVLKRKRSSNSATSMIEFLQKKTDSENQLSKEKIELEKKRVEVEEKRQVLDQERIALEKEERKAMIDLFKELINKVNK